MITVISISLVYYLHVHNLCLLRVCGESEWTGCMVVQGGRPRDGYEELDLQTCSRTNIYYTC